MQAERTDDTPMKKYLFDASIFLRNRNFTLLFIGQFTSLFGTMITSVAVPYQIYTQTHSTLMVGLVSLFQLIPLLFTALIGGVFADRYHRRQLLLIAELILGLGSLVLVINAMASPPHIWVIFLLASFMSAFNGLHRPALESLVQQLVDKKDLPAVSSLASIKSNICMIAGPALGGVLVATCGLPVTYLIDFCTFIVSLIALLSMHNIPAPAAAAEDESTLASLKQGFRYALSRQELMGTYYVDFLAMVFGMPTALFPALAASLGGPQVLGMLYAAPAAGALLVSFFSGWMYQVRRHGVAIALAAIGWGVAIICFGLSTHIFIALFFLAVAGAFDAISGIFRTIMWNESIPQYLRGRMAGIEMISYLSGPRLGDTEAGLVAAAFGVTASIVSGGVLCILGVGLCSYFMPVFWRYRSAVQTEEGGSR